MSVQTIQSASGRPGWTGSKRNRELNRNLVQLAPFLDEAIRIPGTSRHIGADGLIGLIPGVGDLATAVVGLLMLQEWRRLGLPLRHRARIIAYYVIDAAIGIVPGLGTCLTLPSRHTRAVWQCSNITSRSKTPQRSAGAAIQVPLAAAWNRKRLP